MTTKILSVTNISKKFRYQVLDNISFSINKGEVVSLTGLNGAGKSTLIKIILGLLKPDNGKIELNVEPKQEIGVILQDVSLPDDMKVVEWLTLISNFSNNSNYNLNQLLKTVNLEKYKMSLCSTLSGGNKRKLQFAVSIVNKPRLLILDEPTTGLDYKAKREFWMLLKNMVNDTSLTVLVITHDLDEVENFTDRLLILNSRKIITDVNVRKLMTRLKQKGTITITTKQNLSQMASQYIWQHNQSKEEWRTITDNIDSTVSNLLSLGISYKNIKVHPMQLSEFFESVVDSKNA